MTTCLDYDNFLSSKLVTVPPVGFAVDPSRFNPSLFPWQQAIVSYCSQLGRAAIFAGCGLGKTLMEMQWCEIISREVDAPSLILTPLGVRAQFAREAAKFGFAVTSCEDRRDVRAGINITNYDRLDKFDPSVFGAVGLDEASILKNFMGMTKRQLEEAFANTPYKLAATATPAPNDWMEILNIAQWLGIMPSNEALARWFINDPMNVGHYVLKAHAEADFFLWLASWAVCLLKPSDLGDYSDEGYILPELITHIRTVSVDWTQNAADGELFRNPKLNATTMHQEKRLTAAARAQAVADVLAADTTGEPWCIWCSTDYEADALTACIPDAVEVRGSEPTPRKEQKLLDFSDGRIQKLITKPGISGYGMNWQHCHKTACVGVTYSFEDLHQLTARFQRFGQQRQVELHLFVADTEGAIQQELDRKRRQHDELVAKMIAARKEIGLTVQGRKSLKSTKGVKVASGRNWTMRLGDSCVSIKDIPDDTAGFQVMSPPFKNLYIYSDDIADMGNCVDGEEFFTHFQFLIPELSRILKPGRLCAIHCKDLPLYEGRDGVRGLEDFPGEIVRAFLGSDAQTLLTARKILLRLGMGTKEIDDALTQMGPTSTGWAFHSRVTIWKDPVTEMQRTKNHGLLYKELCKDSSGSRQGMADYLLVFRNWKGDVFPDPVHGSNPERFADYIGLEPPDPTHIADRHGLPRPIVNKDGRWPHHNPFPAGSKAYREWSIMVWQKYASPVWFDIDQTNVLNHRIARSDRDQKHICPLQLDVIKRAIHLWSNPRDIVYSPFAGVGSEGYGALELDRQFEGGELKPEYWKIACSHLTGLEADMSRVTLLDLMAEPEAVAA